MKHFVILLQIKQLTVALLIFHIVIFEWANVLKLIWQLITSQPVNAWLIEPFAHIQAEIITVTTSKAVHYCKLLQSCWWLFAYSLGKLNTWIQHFFFPFPLSNHSVNIIFKGYFVLAHNSFVFRIQQLLFTTSLQPTGDQVCFAVCQCGSGNSLHFSLFSEHLSDGSSYWHLISSHAHQRVLFISHPHPHRNKSELNTSLPRLP